MGLKVVLWGDPSVASKLAPHGDAALDAVAKDKSLQPCEVVHLPQLSTDRTQQNLASAPVEDICTAAPSYLLPNYRKFQQEIDDAPAAGDASPARAVYSRRGKRPSSRPTTGTSAKLLFTPGPTGSEPRALLSSRHDRSPSGKHHHHRQAKAGTNDSPTANNPRRAAATTGSHAGRRNEWNESTLVDVLHAPDALLRKHPGWDVAAGAGGPQPEGRLGNRGAFFFGGSSTARTITTRETSSGGSSVVGGRCT